MLQNRNILGLVTVIHLNDLKWFKNVHSPPVVTQTFLLNQTTNSQRDDLKFRYQENVEQKEGA